GSEKTPGSSEANSQTPSNEQGAPNSSASRRVKPAACQENSQSGSREIAGVTSAAGFPDAPDAGPSARSKTVTAIPRRASARAIEAPAIPAPATATRRGSPARPPPAACGYANQGAPPGGSKTGRSISPIMRSRLPANPGSFSTRKPAAASRSRTATAEVNDPSVAVSLERAAISRKISSVH